MFRNSPVMFALYREVHVELRLLHVPRGVLSELKLFDGSGGNRVLFLCERHNFIDSHEALSVLAGESRGYIDRWIEKRSASRGLRLPYAESSDYPCLPLDQEICWNSAIHAHGFASQLAGPLIGAHHLRQAAGYQSR